MTTIAYADFEKVDIRIGTILAAHRSKARASPALRLEIDFGPEIGVKKSSAQLTVHYTPVALVGRQVAAVVNFPPRQIGKFMSEVLTLGFPDGDVPSCWSCPTNRCRTAASFSSALEDPVDPLVRVGARGCAGCRQARS
jgi:tRNA-binding protein